MTTISKNATSTKQITPLLEYILQGAMTKRMWRLMFENFTEKSLKVMHLAQEESRVMNHRFVGTEQILVGLIAEGTGMAAKTLRNVGVSLDAARVEVEKIIGRGSKPVTVEIPFTPRAKRMLDLSRDEARKLSHDHVGTAHLLLGLIRENEGVAARVLENLGVDGTKVSRHILALIAEGNDAS